MRGGTGKHWQIKEGSRTVWRKRFPWEMEKCHFYKVAKCYIIILLFFIQNRCYIYHTLHRVKVLREPKNGSWIRKASADQKGSRTVWRTRILLVMEKCHFYQVAKWYHQSTIFFILYTVKMLYIPFLASGKTHARTKNMLWNRKALAD